MAPGNGMQGRDWVLAAMIFAVAMTFIDQTIVSIAVPHIQRELLAAVVAFLGLERGRQEVPADGSVPLASG
jgi:hypothetical protein